MHVAAAVACPGAKHTHTHFAFSHFSLAKVYVCLVALDSIAGTTNRLPVLSYTPTSTHHPVPLATEALFSEFQENIEAKNTESKRNEIAVQIFGLENELCQPKVLRNSQMLISRNEGENTPNGLGNFGQ